MDACARIKGVPVRSRATVRKETVRESGVHSVKSLFRNKKELCSICLEVPTRDTTRLTEINFVCLPSQCEGDEAGHQPLLSLPVGLCELLRPHHIQSLKQDEVLLLKDYRRVLDHKDAASQVVCKAVCVMRHSPGVCPQAGVPQLLGLLGCYIAGVRFALEQHVLRGFSGSGHQEEDDTNQSVSSIEDDFVTALEHLEEEEAGDGPGAASFRYFKKRDVASQTIPSHKRKKELLGSRVIISSVSKKPSKHKSSPDVSVTVQRSEGVESQWTICSPKAPLPSLSDHISESEESDCSSPSPIIFLDDVGYQKSLLAKLDIPQVPGGPRDPVEDSDSEVSEFFDSFDQFDDLDEQSTESCTLALPLDPISAPNAQNKPTDASTARAAAKYVSRGCSTKGMNPQRFEAPTLPAGVKKPTPLKPGSPYSHPSELPESPRPVHTPSDENGGPLFSPVSSSAFSPLTDGSGNLEYFWKTDEDGKGNTELRKPQDLCSLYKTYSDFASNMSKEIMESVCGFQSAVDISDNKNLSCVCHKEFTNPLGHVMKLSEIQETVTVAKLQKTSQSLKDGIQRFATDLVEMSLGSAFRDLQNSVSSCTTTLCHLAARLTSSVFQMAFHEIGMRHAYVLKERAINGLAGFLVGEALSGALSEFLTVKKQIFHNTVTRFAADLAEELVFEGIMEVCQFSHPSTPHTPSDRTFALGSEKEEEEEVVSSYASDLSESVLQEAFIQLSQADVAFTSQAAISLSVDNMCYVSAENTHTSSTFANQQVMTSSIQSSSRKDPSCTVKTALLTVSGMASCVPVPKAGHALSHVQQPEASSSENAPYYDTTTSTQTPPLMQEEDRAKSPFQNFSGNMVDKMVTEACELITASKVKKSFGDCADFFSKIGSQKSSDQGNTDSSSQSGENRNTFKYDCKESSLIQHVPGPSRTSSLCQGKTRSHVDPRTKSVGETHPTMLDTLDVPSVNAQRRRSVPVDEPNSGQKSGGTPGTPPSTPQQHSEVSKEKQIKQFSKKLKTKLAKEFAPATPPPTPHYQPEPDPKLKDPSPEAEKAEFMIKLMRSLSEEAEGNENEDDEEMPEESVVCIKNKSFETGHKSSRRMSNKEALHYAERLACHIVSMATEMDTLGMSDEEEGSVSGARRRDSVAQFSEQTLNALWVYAGEVAGEVINDVKRMVSSGQQCPYHTTIRRRSYDRPTSERVVHTGQNRPGRLADHWSNDLIASVLRSTPSSSTASSSSSGLSSEYPSCESVTDEYAGYLIKVLKKEGGSRELVLDQYASRLAYRSIKLGLAHASRKIKHRSSSARLSLSKSLTDESKRETFSTKHKPRISPSNEEAQCSCKSEEQSQKDYVDLVNFAESLAYSITCDISQKMHRSSVRLPKSLTDSCLYKKSQFNNMAENLIRNSFSCPLLSREGQRRHHHSTGSLYDSSYSSRMMQVIEHYARKIVDDTLKMSLASMGPTPEHQRILEHTRHSHAQRLSEGAVLGHNVRERTCHYCQERPFCSKLSSHHHLHPAFRRRTGSEGPPHSSMDIPKIHIDLDRKAAFAEEMVSMAMEVAKRELSNTSLNADSGIGYDGASYAESLTAEIITSALTNVCQAASNSSQGREVTESTVSQQLSVGDDSVGSWSNLSFEDEHPDDNSSFLHLSDSDHIEDKETETREESSGTVCADRTEVQAPRTALVVLNTDVVERVRGHSSVTFDPQLRSLLQWVAASMVDIHQIQLSPDRELQQLPAVVQKLREKRWGVGELLHTLLRYCEDGPAQSQPLPREESLQAGREPARIPLFQWLLEHA
ncbi:A-kinase anchor protein 11 isoform X2 [Periophthalmus magnuspinnatus]|uniref:A-kinase anchor protein 11 isoform X2 n=1 Tax=Periophthalmus magnuspinnatus TaxID=409849 RepID=UPI00243702BA|nr:A-kinase anchor protein 11 isoform X2 [Periophthalmus magnuspinnatus]